MSFEDWEALQEAAATGAPTGGELTSSFSGVVPFFQNFFHDDNGFMDVSAVVLSQGTAGT